MPSVNMNTFKRTLLAGALFLALALTVSSCDVLDVEPSQSLGQGPTLSSVSGFKALLIGAYDDLQDPGWYGQFYMLYPDALADNITQTSAGGNRYSGPITNSRGSYLTRWGLFYETINKTNVILANLEGLTPAGSEAEAQDIKDRLRGSALFLRALTYFDLMRSKAYEPGVIADACDQEVCDQGVIIRTEPTQTVDEALQQLPRSSIGEVYNLIEQDLSNAIPLLDAPKLFPVQNKFLASKAAAQALLAQVQLYAKEYGAAAQTASNALDTATGSLGAVPLTQDTYVDALSGADTPSGIFVLDMEKNRDGDATFVNEAPGSLTYNCDSFNFQLIPTQDLINAYSDGDVRTGLFETLECGNAGVITRLNKYTQVDGTDYSDDIVIIRLAEVRLILAEARARSGDESGGQDALNDLLERRGLDDVSLSGSDLTDEILHQRRLELVYEGERWFDLKRLGMDIPKPQSLFNGSVLPYSNYRILAPLPSDEVLQNENLLQNRGYN